MRFGTACTVLSAAATATTASSSPSNTATRASTIFDHQQRQLVSSHIIDNVNVIVNENRSVPTRKEKRLTSLLSKHRQQYQQQVQNTGLLRNVQSGTSTDVERRECDPTLTTTANKIDNDGEVDVGILSCGLGQYCRPSSDSTLGGFCANYRSNNNDDEASTAASSTDRNLQVLNDVIDFCQDVEISATATGKSFGASGPITCDVCNVDVAEYTGQINCTYTESCYVLGGLCPEDTDMTRFCETTSVEANLTAVDEYVYKT